MILRLNLPSKAWGSQFVNIAGKRYKFIYRYNSRDEYWRVSVKYENESLIENYKLVEGEIIKFTTKLSSFNHGILVLVNAKNTTDSPGRYNIGIDKDYEFIYLSLDEIA